MMSALLMFVSWPTMWCIFLNVLFHLQMGGGVMAAFLATSLFIVGFRSPVELLIFSFFLYCLLREVG